MAKEEKGPVATQTRAAAAKATASREARKAPAEIKAKARRERASGHPAGEMDRTIGSYGKRVGSTAVKATSASEARSSTTASTGLPLDLPPLKQKRVRFEIEGRDNDMILHLGKPRPS